MSIVRKALLVGITDAGSKSFDQLPACANDVDAMYDLLKAANRFGEIERLVDASATDILDKLKSLQSKSDPLEELLVYFSGHGFRGEDELVWVASGFDTQNPNSTGVANSDLYDVLRHIGAEQTIVIQDACFSGYGWVKGEAGPSQRPLEKLIEFSSSWEDSTTPSGIELSPYTDHFIEAACYAKSEGAVDYGDISRKLKDLVSNSRLAPHSKHQGDLFVEFCDDVSKLDVIRSKYEIVEPSEGEAVTSQEPALAAPNPTAILEAATKNILSKDDVTSTLEQIALLIEARFNAHADLPDYFEYSTTSHDGYYHLSNEKQLVETYQRLPQWDDFVDASHERVEQKKRRGMIAAASAIHDMMYGLDYEEVYRFELRTPLAKVHQVFHLTPKFEILRRCELELCFVPGLLEMHYFSRWNVQGFSDWGEFTDEKKDQRWTLAKVDREGLKAQLDKLLDGFFDRSIEAVSRTVKNLEARR
ncbi:caspase family protein [Lentibacter algarum]|uniref:caspase family protein n=1 Tax=Lentibacter algarum TaxID=576131 RepID=UPI001C08FB81|nr:caspase family protein [Lentibacter algarum]MBU2982432.1 caspase family protein [Lentibacter algarum]